MESADVCAGINSMGRDSSPGRGESPVQGAAMAEAAGEEGRTLAQQLQGTMNGCGRGKQKRAKEINGGLEELVKNFYLFP